MSAGYPKPLSACAQARTERDQNAQHEKIAVIGMAARLPGAETLDAFWDLLMRGRSGLQLVTSDDLIHAGQDPDLIQAPDYVPVWGGPAWADGFDAGFFGYAPREACQLDPQQRMFLECAWHAFEHAGYGSTRPDKTGVFAGASLSSHLLRADPADDPFAVGLANIGGMVAARVSYHLDLRGPAIGVQTTCSSALVAIDQAMQSLRQRQSDLALAGAVAVNQSRPEGYWHHTEGISAPDGICRPFDAQAAGTVFANGAGAVVLKRLDDAQRDGDQIYGVLLSVGVNNDGGAKVSLTAPSVAGQAGALTAALEAAHLSPADIDFVEAHGTGTALGDPIELNALNRSYGPGLAAAGRRCGLGAVKGNLGHLDAASGMAGLLKLLLAFQHEHLPGTAHFDTPSPACMFGAFDVFTAPRPWPRDQQRPRRAGLSAFGIGGTNAHLIIEEPPAQQLVAPASLSVDRQCLLPFSAQSSEALAQIRRDLAEALEQGLPLAGIAQTLQTGRARLKLRQSITARTPAEAIAALSDPKGAPVEAAAGAPDLIHVFTGQGSQFPGMARALYDSEPGFRAAFDICLSHMPQSDLQSDLLRAMLLDADSPQAQDIHQTRFAQPALFVLEYALAQLWLERTSAPVAMVGHSLGELVAAAVAGVMDLPDACRLICARGAAMQNCPPGSMVAVMMSETEARNCLDGGLEIAALNGPRATVLSGPADAVTALASQLERSGIGARQLQTSHGFHSAAMEAACAPFRAAFDGVTLRAPAIAILSNVTGTWLTEAEATDPGYWVRQMRRPVRFGDAIAVLKELDRALLLEIGPGAGLIRLARQQVKSAQLVASLPEGAEDLLQATGALWAAGARINWPALEIPPDQRISLPGYPFQRQSCWLPPQSGGARGGDDDCWIYQRVWQRQPAGTSARELPEACLVFGASALAGHLPDLPADWTRVEIGEGFAADGDGYRINPTCADDYRALFDATGGPAPHIICAWGLGSDQSDLLFRGTVALAQALARAGAGHSARITLIGAGMADVSGQERLDPDAALALGLLATLPQECRTLRLRAIDLDPAGPHRAAAMQGLTAPWSAAPGPAILAVRGGYLWSPDYVATPIDPCDMPNSSGSVALVGALRDGLTTAFAEGLGAAKVRRLILAGHGLPERENWIGWLTTHGPEDATSQIIRSLIALEQAGVDIRLCPGDPADADWLAGLLRDQGPLAGVIYTTGMGDTAFCPLDEMTPQTIDRLVTPKLRELTALAQILQGQTLQGQAPDYVLIQSSLSAVVGGVGLAGYAAANAALEAFVANVPQTGPRWQVVAWDIAQSGSLGPYMPSDLRVLTGQEIWEAACRVISCPDLRHATVTPGSLRARMASAMASPDISQSQSLAGPPARTKPLIAARTATEQAVVQVMAGMLGFDEISVEDNFFELGGHSLLAIQIVNQLRKEFAVELPIRALLFEAPTAAGIAEAIDKAVAQAGAEADILESLLDEIETPVPDRT